MEADLIGEVCLIERMVRSSDTTSHRTDPRHHPRRSFIRPHRLDCGSLRSRLGALLDPAADRLYIVSALIALALRNVVPLWLVAVLLGREAVLGIMLLVLRHYGYPPLQVHYLGKAATFLLLYAFPTLLLAASSEGTVAA